MAGEHLNGSMARLSMPEQSLICLKLTFAYMRPFTLA